MASITAELIETGEKRDRQGRRVTPALRRAELVEQYRHSGLTQAGFARREGLCYSTFAGWVLRAERKKANRPVVRFAEVALPAAPQSGLVGLEVRLPDGTLLRGGSAAELAKLVRALRS